MPTPSKTLCILIGVNDDMRELFQRENLSRERIYEMFPRLIFQNLFLIPRAYFLVLGVRINDVQTFVGDSQPIM